MSVHRSLSLEGDLPLEGGVSTFGGKGVYFWRQGYLPLEAGVSTFGGRGVYVWMEGYLRLEGRVSTFGGRGIYVWREGYLRLEGGVCTFGGTGVCFQEDAVCWGGMPSRGLVCLSGEDPRPIRWTGGWYASYWSAYLFSQVTSKWLVWLNPYFSILRLFKFFLDFGMAHREKTDYE